MEIFLNLLVCILFGNWACAGVIFKKLSIKPSKQAKNRTLGEIAESLSNMTLATSTLFRVHQIGHQQPNSTVGYFSFTYLNVRKNQALNIDVAKEGLLLSAYCFPHTPIFSFLSQANLKFQVLGFKEMRLSSTQ